MVFSECLEGSISRLSLLATLVATFEGIVHAKRLNCRAGSPTPVDSCQCRQARHATNSSTVRKPAQRARSVNCWRGNRGLKGEIREASDSCARAVSRLARRTLQRHIGEMCVDGLHVVIATHNASFIDMMKVEDCVFHMNGEGRGKCG